MDENVKYWRNIKCWSLYQYDAIINLLSEQEPALEIHSHKDRVYGIIAY